MKGKHAVVFGAGGSIGTAVAKELAKEGAEVFLSGRTKSAVEAVAAEIIANKETIRVPRCRSLGFPTVASGSASLPLS